jgi:hypothetical protein
MFRAWKRGRAVALFVAVMLAASPAFAQAPPIGQIKKATGSVSVIRGGERLPAKPGAPLYRSDVVETGGDGSVGITLADATTFSTGPSSLLALNEFVFDPGSGRGSLAAEFKRGTLAVVSGGITRANPGAMKIKTPTAVLGVRGTIFGVQVAAAPPRELFVVLPNADGSAGAISIGNTILNQPYFTAEMQNGVAVPVSLSAAEVAAIFADALAAQPAPTATLLSALLAQFPDGGSGLSAAIEQLVETDPTQAAAAVAAAATANPAQQQAIGVGLAAAAVAFANAAAAGGSNAAAAADAQQLILAAMASAPTLTQAGFVAAGGFSQPTTTIGGGGGGAGFGMTTNSNVGRCVSPTGPGGTC